MNRLTAAEEQSMIDRTRLTYGFWLERCDFTPVGWLVMVPHGKDTDGSPLTLARGATPLEIQYWVTGQHRRLAERLKAQNVPGVKVPGGWWKRVWGWLTGGRS